ncbi:sigma-54-dependent transcriptional regulator [Thermodesulfobacteriota bacterium]
MSKNTNNSILWTAKDLTLPETLWKRLESRGYRVLLTDNGNNITDKLNDLTPRLWVGQTNGKPESDMENVREIKSKYPHLSIILMSSNPNVEDAVSAIKMGVSDYIPGKISSEELWAIIEKALDYQSPINTSSPKLKRNVKNHNQPIAANTAMIKILAMAKKIAPRRSSILINGETGTGKEVLARYIHDSSDRSDGPFIAVNCAALPENLLESELFGHEKGAFTGAVSLKKGKFELACNGTLLLDEISETDVSIQAKLLRVLQEREIDRVGGQSTIPVDVRIIATTNRDLAEETKNGNFRLDLYYRLNVVPLSLPPLRKRPDDIKPLAEHFLNKHCEFNNIPLKNLTNNALEYLKKKNWKGNVREFENLIERATLLVDSDVIDIDDLEIISSPEALNDSVETDINGILPLKEMEKKMIYHALDNNKGNRTHAAKILGISVRTLRNKLNEYRNNLEEG